MEEERLKQQTEEDEDKENNITKIIIVIQFFVIILIIIAIVFVMKHNRKQDAGTQIVETEELAGIVQEEDTETETVSEAIEETEIVVIEEETEEATGENASVDGEAAAAFTEPDANGNTDYGMNFTAVEETVTAKEATNLRDIPSQGADSTVLVTLKNGDTAVRIGVSDSGWSRLTYNGMTCYAISSYLTTDLNYTVSANVEGTGDGLKTKFTECNDTVTAKIEVNLRALPSVTNPDAAVIAVLHNGEAVTRTGINEDYGWSRVDYNGQTLYCISSYITTVP